MILYSQKVFSLGVCH